MRKPGVPRFVLFAALVALPVFGQQDQSAPASQDPSSQKGSSPKAPAASPPESDPPGATLPASLPDLTPDANGNLSQEQMRQLGRVVTENYRSNYKKERDYTYVDREVENKLDGQGDIKSTESETYEIMELYGEQVRRLIAKDDKPLSERDSAKEEEKIKKLTDKRRNESEEERAKRRAEEEKQREKNREFVREIPDAFDFRLVGSELLNGRDTWVLMGEPRPGFRAQLKEAEILPKYHGRLWIDKSDAQLAKMDVEALDTVSFGWFLARIHKGTRLVIEWTRVNGEVWLPQRVNFKFDARIALFKGYNEETEQTYSDYKKFRATGKIVSVGDVKP
jgi:hypothetical protein